MLLLWLPIEGEYPEKPTKPLTGEDWISVIKNAETLKRMPEDDKMLSVVVDGLRLYSQALQARLPYGRLLGFWQLAETLTLSEKSGGKTDTVCNRLVAFRHFWSDDAEVFRFALTGVAEKETKLSIRETVPPSITRMSTSSSQQPRAFSVVCSALVAV